MPNCRSPRTTLSPRTTHSPRQHGKAPQVQLESPAEPLQLPDLPDDALQSRFDTLQLKCVRGPGWRCSQAACMHVPWKKGDE